MLLPRCRFAAGRTPKHLTHPKRPNRFCLRKCKGLTIEITLHILHILMGGG